MATNYGYGKIVTDELVLALDAADRNSYPGSGTTWSDLSGNGNNGTLTNGPTFDSGNAGSIVLDGTNDYVNIGKIDNTSNISFFGWAKNNGSFVNYNNIISKDAPGVRVYQITLYQGRLQEHLRNITAANQVTNNAWFCYAMTSESGVGTTLYLNNQVVASSATAVPANTSTRATQLHTYYGGQVSGGLSIAQSLIYNKTLTFDELSQNYYATKTRFGL